MLKEVEIVNLKDKEKDQIEKDIREIIEMPREEEPIVLDLEAIRVIKPGHFEIDIGKVFRGEKPFVVKLEEGKYIIDLSAGMDSLLDTKKKTPVEKGIGEEDENFIEDKKVEKKKKRKKEKKKEVVEIETKKDESK